MTSLVKIDESEIIVIETNEEIFDQECQVPKLPVLEKKDETFLDKNSNNKLFDDKLEIWSKKKDTELLSDTVENEMIENSSNQLVRIISDGTTFVIPITEIEKERSDLAFESALAVLDNLEILNEESSEPRKDDMDSSCVYVDNGMTEKSSENPHEKFSFQI